MSYSLFDVVGPVMHGPSSTHTAGANRIGYLASQLMKGTPFQAVTLLFHPDYLKSYEGQNTHVALVAGILGIREYEEKANSSLSIAKEKGLKIKVDSYPFESKNMFGIRFEPSNDLVIGNSTGGGNIRMIRFNEEEISLTGNEKEVVTRGVKKEIEPLFLFRDQGRKPLIFTFSDLYSLNKPIEDIPYLYEMDRSGASKEQILNEALFFLDVAEKGIEEGKTRKYETLGGLVEGDEGLKLWQYMESGRSVLGETYAKALAYSVMLATSNAAKGRIVACPTGGAAGSTLAAVIAAGERFHSTEKKLAEAVLIAALMGVIIGNQASFSGTFGGCSGEIGIGAAMGAGAVAYLGGGDLNTVVQATVLTLKNVMGLTCDPPTSFTEIPCIKRNGYGAGAAFFGAEMALAGITSAIDPDDVVTAFADTQKRMDPAVKFGGTGGLAATPSGKRLKDKNNKRS